MGFAEVLSFSFFRVKFAAPRYRKLCLVKWQTRLRFQSFYMIFRAERISTLHVMQLARMHVHPCPYPSPQTPFLPSFLPSFSRSFVHFGDGWMDASSDTEILLGDGDIARIDEAAAAPPDTKLTNRV